MADQEGQLTELEKAKLARKEASRMYWAMAQGFHMGNPELAQLHEGLALALEAGDEEGLQMLQESVCEVLRAIANVLEEERKKVKLWTPKVIVGKPKLS